MSNMSESKLDLLATYPDVLTFKQLCSILQIARQTGYNLLHANKIKYRRVGNKFIIAKNSVIEFLHSSEK